MKTLQPHILDPVVARRQWHELEAHLASKPVLDERKDILPFFRTRDDLSLLISFYYPAIRNPDLIAHEFPLGGDFTADLVVGDSTTKEYLLVEFENASSGSIFTGKRAKRNWAPRFEGALSQLIDWIWKLDDLRRTTDFATTFGGSDASFHGLILIGKDLQLSPSEAGRLRWRVEHTMVDSKRIEAKSFDALLADADYWLSAYMHV